MQLLIVGAGAVGTYLGAFLGRSGQLVTLVGRPEFSRAAINRDFALRVTLPGGTGWQTANVRVVSSIADAANSEGLYEPPYDAVLVCVKTYDVDAVVSEVLAHVERLCYPDQPRSVRTIFLCFENGVGSERRIAACFGAGNVWAATTTSPLTVPEPGVVHVEREHGTICVAPLRPRAHLSSRARHEFSRHQVLLIHALKGAFFDMRVYEDGQAMKWSKLLLNMLGNATSAILGMPPGAVYANRTLFHFEMLALREAVRVMRCLGLHAVNLPGYPSRYLANAVRYVPEPVLQPVLRRRLARGRGTKWPSFYYDVINQTHRCEVNWLNGAIARYGNRVGIRTPVNEHLTVLLEHIVRGEDRPEAWRGQVDQLATVL